MSHGPPCTPTYAPWTYRCMITQRGPFTGPKTYKEPVVSTKKGIAALLLMVERTTPAARVVGNLR